MIWASRLKWLDMPQLAGFMFGIPNYSLVPKLRLGARYGKLLLPVSREAELRWPHSQAGAWERANPNQHVGIDRY
jgi:hypothetical protein